MRKNFLNVIAISALGFTALFARADDTPPQSAPPFQVFPADINLETATDIQSVVVQFTRPDGITQDITSEVKFEIADPEAGRH